MSLKPLSICAQPLEVVRCRIEKGTGAFNVDRRKDEEGQRCPPSKYAERDQQPRHNLEAGVTCARAQPANREARWQLPKASGR